MASGRQYGFPEFNPNSSNDPYFVTGTPQEFLFDTPFNYDPNDDFDEEEDDQPVDLTPGATPLDFTNKPVSTEGSAGKGLALPVLSRGHRAIVR